MQPRVIKRGFFLHHTGCLGAYVHCFARTGASGLRVTFYFSAHVYAATCMQKSYVIVHVHAVGCECFLTATSPSLSHVIVYVHELHG
jgi:hypothetical protein